MTGGGTVAPVHHAIPGPDAETLVKLAAAEAEVRGLRELLAEVTRTRDTFERQLADTTAALTATTRLLPAPDSKPEPVRRWWWLRAG